MLLIITAIIFSLSSCSSKIHKLTIEDISNVYLGITSYDHHLNVSGLKYDEKDIKAIIKNPDIAKIAYEKWDGLFSDYISFDITGLKCGKTTLYFETYDKSIKSNTVEIVVKPNVSSIEFTDSSNIRLNKLNQNSVRNFVFDSHGNALYNEFECISEDNSIAEIEFINSSNQCKIHKTGNGETYILIRTKDKNVQSDKIKVICSELPSDEDMEEKFAYITPKGKKCHISKSCAGTNAYKIPLRDALKNYEPCKLCAVGN